MNARKLAQSASLFSVLSKLLNSINTLITLFLVGIFLSPNEQGFFFSLISLSLLFVFFELGLNFVVIQFASHEHSALLNADNAKTRADAQSRLISLGRIAFLWFGLGALFFALFAGGGGTVFFYTIDGGSVAIGPWLMLCGVVALDVALMPFWSLLEGTNQVLSVYRYRTLRVIIMGSSTWAALVLGADLWALGIGYLASLPLSGWMIFKRHHLFFRQFRHRPSGAVILWQSELFPFQWRLAISWICGYFATWAVAPLSVKMFDPVVGGQVGMVWSLAAGVTTISTALITVKAPQFGMLVAERKFAALDRSALRVGGLSVIAAIAGCSTIFIAVWILNSQHYPYAQRLLPLKATALILVATVFLQILQPMAVYLRAHKQEPFLPVSLALAVTSLAGIVILGRLYGPLGIAYGYLIAVTCFALPLAWFIFLRCRRKWHSPRP